MYTRTITLAGAALASFLAAGGQTVDPDAPSTAVNDATAAAATTSPSQVPFPIVETTTTAEASPEAVAATTTSSPSRVAIVNTSPTTTSTPTSTSISTSTSTSIATPTPTPITTSSSIVVINPTTTTSLIASVHIAAISAVFSTASRAAISTKETPSSTLRIASSSRAVSSIRSISSSHSVSSVLSSALNKDKSKTSNSGISGGGIGGLIVGLILLFGFLAAASILWRKRKQRESEEVSRESRRNEKGMVRLEESEVSTPSVNGGQGFDFGHLTSIAPTPQMNSDANTFKSTASPAALQQGAAVLGIKRPFTPPPGHPAHPNYKQPPAMAAKQMQQRSAPAGHTQPSMPQFVAGDGVQNIPRRPVPAAAAPVVQRQLSSNNPFSDPPLASPLARSTAPVQTANIPPVVESSSAKSTTVPEPVQRRASIDSFMAGDDSFEGETLPSATTTTLPAGEAVTDSTSEITTSQNPEAKVAPTAVERPMSTAGQDGQPARTKSIIAATDDWAARKAHLKNTLALHSNPTSPALEQSPFSDPAPVIDHEISALSPMILEFAEHNNDE